MTGMRIGEASALQWDDVDFDEWTLNISKTLYYKNDSNYRFTEPKTSDDTQLEHYSSNQYMNTTYQSVP